MDKRRGELEVALELTLKLPNKRGFPLEKKKKEKRRKSFGPAAFLTADGEYFILQLCHGSPVYDSTISDLFHITTNSFG